MGSPISKYFLFALLAIIINLLIQHLTLSIYQGSYDVYLALCMGTGVGLVLKYILDKFFVFKKEKKSLKEEGNLFLIYSFLGVFTTLFYWAVELSFHYLLSFPSAKYIGGALGLIGGYLIKYYLDKRFVFQE